MKSSGMRASVALVCLCFVIQGSSSTRLSAAQRLPEGSSNTDEHETDEDDTLLRHRARHKRQDDLLLNNDLQGDLDPSLREIDPEEQKRQFKTKLFGDVEVVIKDPNFAGQVVNNPDVPLTLQPKLVRDKFAIQRDSAVLDLEPSSVVKTEFSTFTYLVTSLAGGSTVTKTDIIVSSNVVTEALYPEPTPSFEIQPSSSPSNYEVLATKTYFTTSTYYTTVIDRSETITKTRTMVKSSIVTETFTGGDIQDAAFVAPTPTLAPSSEPTLISGEGDVKYLELGPNIYGKIKTLYNTYTYFTTRPGGQVDRSKEIVTQISTSLFSTTRLPETIKLNLVGNRISSSSSVQLNPSRLSVVKNNFISSSAALSGSISTADPSVKPSETAISQESGVSSTSSSSSSILLDDSYLSSLKDSFASVASSIESSSNSAPVTDINLPTEGPESITPPPIPSSSSNVQGSSVQTTPATIDPSRPLDTQHSSTVGSSAESSIGGGNGGNDQSSSNGNNSGSSSSSGIGSSTSNQNITPTPATPGSNGPNDQAVSGSTESSGGSGVIDAVVGGLGGVFGAGAPNVDLGPVLDAVATLLRGPIRSAIANRRSQVKEVDRSDIGTPQRIITTKGVPNYAYLKNRTPNVAPIRAATYQRQRPNYAPLQQRDVGGSNNGLIPPAFRNDQTPRIDVDVEGGDNYLTSFNNNEPVVRVPQDVYEALKKKEKTPDEPVYLDNDRLIINDHIIKSNDPHIVDVLNRFEQSHLFGKYENGPMAIKIVPGLPMNYPQQVTVPGKSTPSQDYVYIGDGPPTQPRIPQPRPSGPPPPPPSAQRPAQPPRPQQPRYPSKPGAQRPRPLGGPRGNRPPPPPPPRRPLPQGGRPRRPQYPQGRPQRPNRPLQSRPRQPVDVKDSVNQHSINNEIIVKAPPNVVAQNVKRPGAFQNNFGSNQVKFTNVRGNSQGNGFSQNAISERPSTGSAQRLPTEGQPGPNTSNIRTQLPGYPTQPLIPSGGAPQLPGNTGPITPYRPSNGNPFLRPGQQTPHGNKSQPPRLSNQRPPVPVRNNQRPPNYGTVNTQQPSAPIQRPPSTANIRNNQRPPTSLGNINNQQQSISPNQFGRPPVSNNFPGQPSPGGNQNQRPSVGEQVPNIKATIETVPRPTIPKPKPASPPKRQVPPNGPAKVVPNSQPATKPSSKYRPGNPRPGGVFNSRPSNGQLSRPTLSSNSFGPKPNLPYQSGLRPVDSFRKPPIGSNRPSKNPNLPPVPTHQSPVQDQGNIFARPGSPNSGFRPAPTVSNQIDGGGPVRRPTIPLRRPTPLPTRPAPTTPRFSIQTDRADTTASIRPYKRPSPRPTRRPITSRPRAPPFRRPNVPGFQRPSGDYTPIDIPSAGPGSNPNSAPSIASRPIAGKNDRKPYNPNKARKPGVSVPGNGNQFVNNDNSEKKTSEWISTQTTDKDIQDIDPSFNSPIVKSSSGSSIKGIFVNPTGTKGLDYQGWYTEGDSIPAIQKGEPTSSPYIQYTIREKEGPKKTTYASEWSTVGNENVDPTRVDFSPQQRPSLNTNFNREWTVRDEIIEPTKPFERPGLTQSPDSGYSNEWGSFVVKTNDGKNNGNIDGSTQQERPNQLRPLSRPNYQTPPPRRPTVRRPEVSTSEEESTLRPTRFPLGNQNERENNNQRIPFRPNRPTRRPTRRPVRPVRSTPRPTRPSKPTTQKLPIKPTRPTSSIIGNRNPNAGRRPVSAKPVRAPNGQKLTLDGNGNVMIVGRDGQRIPYIRGDVTVSKNGQILVPGGKTRGPKGEDVTIGPNGEHLTIGRNGKIYIITKEGKRKLYARGQVAIGPAGEILLPGQTTVGVEGEKITIGPNGEKLTTGNNGFVLLVAPNGDKTRYTKGNIAIGANGQIFVPGTVTVQPNGEKITIGPNGERLTVRPDGKLYRVFPTGAAVPYFGGQVSVGLNGEIFVPGQNMFGPNGELITIGVNGERLTVGNDGQIEIVQADGQTAPYLKTKATLGENGDIFLPGQVIIGPGNERVTIGLNGERLVIGPKGEVLEITRDGERKLFEKAQLSLTGKEQILVPGQQAFGPNNERVTIGPSGEMLFVGPNGNLMQVKENGGIKPYGKGQIFVGPSGEILLPGQVTIQPSGEPITIGPNGEQLTIGPDGLVYSVGPDSQRTWYVGGKVAVSENGDILTPGQTAKYPSGEEFIVGPNGERLNLDREGRVVMDIGDNEKIPYVKKQIFLSPQGNIFVSGEQLFTITGDKVTVGPNGERLVTGPDGLVDAFGLNDIRRPYVKGQVHATAQGEIILPGQRGFGENGGEFTVGPKGEKIAIGENGEILVIKPNGEPAYYVDGKIAIGPKGEILVPGQESIGPNGEDITIGPNGERIIINDNGQPLVIAANGQPEPYVRGQVSIGPNGEVFVPTQEMISPNGEVMSIGPNGEKLAIDVNGVVTSVDANGEKTPYSRGQIALGPGFEVLVPGQEIVSPNGEKNTIGPNGERLIVDKEGELLLISPNGEKNPYNKGQVTLGPNNEIFVPGQVVVFPTGEEYTIGRKGERIYLNSAGEPNALGPNGEILPSNEVKVSVGPNGEILIPGQITIGPNGEEVTIGPYGEKLFLGTDGNIYSIGPNGQGIPYNGGRVSLGPNGEIFVPGQEMIGPNGERIFIGPNGEQLVYGPNGERFVIGKNGIKTPYEPDQKSDAIRPGDKGYDSNVETNVGPDGQILLVNPDQEGDGERPIIGPNGEIIQLTPGFDLNGKPIDDYRIRDNNDLSENALPTRRPVRPSFRPTIRGVNRPFSRPPSSFRPRPFSPQLPTDNDDKTNDDKTNDVEDSEGIVEIKGTVESVEVPTNRPKRPFAPRPGRPIIRPFKPGQVIDDQPKRDDDNEDLPPGIEPDTGTFINISPTNRVPNTGIIRPTSLVRPSRVRPTIRPSKIDTPNIVTKDNFNTKRPSFFTPRSRTTTDKSTTSDNEDKEPTYKIAGSPYLPSIGKRPPGLTFGINKNDLYDNEAKRKEQLSNNIDGAIVEPIGSRNTAPDTDPVTKCQNTCGLNEICQIKADEILCNCRPGFGRRRPGATCEKSRSYEMEVLTKSESEAITVVRMSPKAFERAVAGTLRQQMKEYYHGSEITSIKVGNSSKRETLFFGGEKNLTRDDAMSINLVVHLAEDSEGLATEERLQSLLDGPIKDTKLPLGADVTVSRVSVQDFNECDYNNHNDCSDQAQCINVEGSYTCQCEEGYHDLSGRDSLPGRVCSATTTECDLCNRNGECILRGQEVTCQCRDWFAGRNCQINLKLLLIVGCVSVGLMIFIACGVSCFCCRDRHSKNLMPSPYGTSTISRVPPSVRSHGMMMDPNGTVKSSRSGMMPPGAIPRAGGPKPKKSSLASSTNLIPRPGLKSGGSKRSSDQVSHTGSWQTNFSGPGSLGAQGMRMHPNPALVIPRARVTRSPAGHFSYQSDDELMSEANRAMSERTSLSSRHRRRSGPSFASGGSAHPGPGGSRRSRSSHGGRAGSVDPLLAEASYSDDSGPGGASASNAGRSAHSSQHLHRSVSRGDLDAQSVARSYNETIIRPVTRPLHTPAGTSYRSNRSHATSEDGRTMAERDGGSSFVVSPTHQTLYRLHDSDGSLDSL